MTFRSILGCAFCGIFAVVASAPAPSQAQAQDGNWRITNSSIGSFAGWATVSGVRSLVGDFTGDNRDDIALIRQTPGWGSMPLAVATATGGWSIRNGGTGSFARWAATNGVRPLVGDFNGDRRDDVALIRQAPGWGSMPVAFSNGTGGWSIRNGGTGSFARWAATNGVRPLVGDFNGDRRDDVALIRQNAGWATMPVALSNGSGGWSVRNNSIGSFAGWATQSGVRPLVGDFDGDGREDVALLRQNAGWGTVPIAFSRGNGAWQITNRSVGSFAGWATVNGVRPLVGDFDGNGRDDIALVRQTAGWGTVPVAFSVGDGNWSIRNGNVGSFASWATRSGVRLLVGDYDADGRDDVALLRQDAGWSTMPVAFARGGGNWAITNNTSGSFAGWATVFGVNPLVGDFTGDGRTDVALLRRASGWGTMPVAIATNQPPITTRRLTVARHNQATGTNADVDRILRDASNVLQTNDGAGDVACAVAFARQGNMTVFNNTDGTLNTAAELNTVFNLGPDMKIVPAVDFCANQFNTSYIGCGQIGRFNLIIERFTASQEGILWAHEIGHNVGLNHRSDTNNALMFPSIGSNRLRINQAECNAFLSSGAPLLSGLNASEADQRAAIDKDLDNSLNVNDEMLLTAETVDDLKADPMMQSEIDLAMYAGDQLNDSLDRSAKLDSELAGMMTIELDAEMGLTPETMEALQKDTMMQTQPDATMNAGDPQAGAEGETPDILGQAHANEDGPLPPVEEFVRQIYFHGLPLARAAEYGPNDLAVLIDILQDPEEALYHENAALTIGMIGENSSVAPLIEHVEGWASSVVETVPGSAEYHAEKGRLAAIVALGYAANLAESNEAVSYLMDQVRTAAANTESIEAAGESKLVEYAIIALGFSGSDAARDMLQTLERGDLGVAAESVGGAASGLIDAAETSMAISQEVAERGLIGYYDR